MNRAVATAMQIGGLLAIAAGAWAAWGLPAILILAGITAIALSIIHEEG